MQISTKDWKNYISRLSALNNKASSLMSEWVAKNGFSDTEALIDFAYAIVTKYGEGSAELTCQMYDAIAEMEGKILPAAVPAQTATYDETAKAVKGCLKRSPSGALVASTSARLVKQVGADTMIHNALRDGAEFAWIPSGDTCPFCLMLASNGWRRASKKAIKKGHAEHIHSNCDCQYCVRFSSDTTVAGYDPDKYLSMYDSYEGSWNDKVNAMRREQYALNKDKINAQKREAYAKRKNGSVSTGDTSKIYSPYDSKPGTGKLLFENGDSPEELRDRETATWLHTKFGGDIKCMPEISGIGKNVDAIWNGDCWEFKAPTTKNAIDDRLRKANSQILETQNRENILGNKCGVVVDISNAKISQEEAIEIIMERAKSRLPNNTDVIIRNGDYAVEIFNVKK